MSKVFEVSDLSRQIGYSLTSPEVMDIMEKYWKLMGAIESELEKMVNSFGSEQNPESFGSLQQNEDEDSMPRYSKFAQVTDTEILDFIKDMKEKDIWYWLQGDTLIMKIDDGYQLIKIAENRLYDESGMMYYQSYNTNYVWDGR